MKPLAFFILVLALTGALLLFFWLGLQAGSSGDGGVCQPSGVSMMRQLSPHERPIAPLPALAPAARPVSERYWL